MRVLLDANVLVSARIKAIGEAGKILNQAETRFTVLLPDFLLDKVAEVLRRPHIQKKYPHLTEEAITDYVAALRDLGEPVIARTAIEPSADTSEDPEDARVLAAAVDGAATHLVTYNTAHFPTAYQHTQDHQRISILLPTRFQQILQQPPQNQPEDTEA